MAVESGVLDSLEQQGLGAVTMNQGLSALELAVSNDMGSAVVCVSPMNWTVMVSLNPGNTMPLFLKELTAPYTRCHVAPKQQIKAVKPVNVNPLVSSLSGLEATERIAGLEALVLETVPMVGGQSGANH